MNADLLIAEIGSTTTLVTAFSGLLEAAPRRVGQGQAETTVAEGDVTIGLHKAVEDMCAKAGERIGWKEMVASSSAAGGLKMTVHGLVHDMTAKAAKEAALGAGANITMVTAGLLDAYDLKEIKKIAPNIILLAGGVDYGEKTTVLTNARLLADSGLQIPVIYAGNTAVRKQVADILEHAGITVFITENVYPRIDQLNVEPTRAIIQEVFEKHITEAPGMSNIRGLVTGRITPTPGAVMMGARLLQEHIGDLLVVDVGGATTDVHSVTAGNEANAAKAVAPEPFAKRTVEGDLGVFVSAPHVLELCDQTALARELECSPEALESLVRPIPQSKKEICLSTHLRRAAAETAVGRHAGVVEYIYGASGRITITRGKDLTEVQWIIGTGGALTCLPGGLETLAALNRGAHGTALLPKVGTPLLDTDYIMAAAGVMSPLYPQAALALMRESLGFKDAPAT